MIHTKTPIRMWTATAAIALLVTLGACRDTAETVWVPPGSTLVVAITGPISTATATEGQDFWALATEPVRANGLVAIREGTRIHGHVSAVDRPGAVGGGARLALEFDEVVLEDGNSFRIHAAPLTLVAESDAHSDVQRVAGTVVAGAIIGGIAKGGTGAAAGALIGAGVGGTWAIATRGDDIVLDAGQRFRVRVTEPSELAVLDTEDPS